MATDMSLEEQALYEKAMDFATSIDIEDPAALLEKFKEQLRAAALAYAESIKPSVCTVCGGNTNFWR